MIRGGSARQFGIMRGNKDPCALWKLDGIHMAKIFLGGFVLYIKCDKPPLNNPFPDIILAPGCPIYAIPRQLEGSQDINALKPPILRYPQSSPREPNTIPPPP